MDGQRRKRGEMGHSEDATMRSSGAVGAIEDVGLGGVVGGSLGGVDVGMRPQLEHHLRILVNSCKMAQAAQLTVSGIDEEQDDRRSSRDGEDGAVSGRSGLRTLGVGVAKVDRAVEGGRDDYRFRSAKRHLLGSRNPYLLRRPILKAARC